MNEIMLTLEKDTWKFYKKVNGISIWTRTQENIEVRLETVINAPFEVALAILTEIDLYNKLIPFVSSSTEKVKVSRNTKVGNMVLSFPVISAR